jgi:beta-glucosidase/6-phospho-beta-glucosidase/beta-galactosidase
LLVLAPHFHDESVRSFSDAVFVAGRTGATSVGYFAWSLLDNWEWVAGYTSRFGLYIVDYKDNLKRYPKNSVQWFRNLLSSS